MNQTENEERLKNNIQIWKQRQPIASSLDFSSVDLTGMSLVKEENGQWNLRFKEQGEKSSLYSSDPLKEEQDWCKTLFESGKQIPQLLIIYGVGLGYSYLILRKWLEISPHFRIVYLEDDPRILHSFFQTEIASQMLSDPRVRLCYFTEQTRSSLYYTLARHYSHMPFKFVGQMYYLQKKSPFLIEMKYDLEHYFRLISIADQELSSFGKGFFSNYFPNLFEAAQSQLASGCYHLFSSLPAIVVGAGPSLQKNLPLLKRLENRALIIAGGTAINALNAAGIDPHICVGVDPNPSHALRILTSTSFMVPYFFHGRTYHPILKVWQGDHCFIRGSSGYPFADYLEKQLGLTAASLDEGFNVVNLSLSLAKALGCRAIATVGVDLAYTQEQSYPPLTDPHPLDQPHPGYKTKTPKEDLVLRTDIEGKPILSLWKWVHESMWLGRFAHDNASIDFVNATEGGLGFPGVENKTLQEFVDKYCVEQWDIRGVVHAAVQMAKRPSTFTYQSVHNLFKESLKGFARCIDYMERIEEEFAKMKRALAEGETPLEGYANATIIENLVRLQDEECYTQLFSRFDANLQSKFQKQLAELSQSVDMLDKENIHDKTLQIHQMRYQLLIKGAKDLKEILENTIKTKELEQEALQKSGCKKVQETVPIQGGYTFTKGCYRIEEPSLSVFVSEKEGEESVEQQTYDWGTLHLHVNRKNGYLHGPFRIYTQDLRLLYESWFANGEKTGFAKGYTERGKLCFVEGYRQGLSEGKRLYYYEDGSVKASCSYIRGTLDGQLLHYHPNGQIKRKLYFSEGKKEGEELLCQESGKPIIQARYKEGLPVGEQLYYNQLGTILRRVIYSKEGNLEKLFMMDRNGELVEYPLYRAKDYYELVSKKVFEMTEEIARLQVELDTFLKALEKERNTQFKEREELKKLAKEIRGLQDLAKKFVEASQKGIGAYNEKIWHTPGNEGILNEQLLLLRNHLNQCMQTLKKQLFEIASAPKE